MSWRACSPRPRRAVGSSCWRARLASKASSSASPGKHLEGSLHVSYCHASLRSNAAWSVNLGTVGDRNCLAAIIYMARTSTPWRLLPARELGCGSPATVWRRLAEWAAVGVFDQLHLQVLDRLGEQGLVGWSRASVDTVSVRARRRSYRGQVVGVRWWRSGWSAAKASRARWRLSFLSQVQAVRRCSARWRAGS
jgi:transposase